MKYKVAHVEVYNPGTDKEYKRVKMEDGYEASMFNNKEGYSVVAIGNTIEAETGKSKDGKYNNLLKAVLTEETAEPVQAKVDNPPLESIKEKNIAQLNAINAVGTVLAHNPDIVPDDIKIGWEIAVRKNLGTCPDKLPALVKAAEEKTSKTAVKGK